MAALHVEEHVALARYSTLHVGGEARALARISSLEDLHSALDWAEQRRLLWFILGGGANFFCRDEGFPGLVIKMENRALAFAGNEMTADAGVVTRVAVLNAVDRGLRGMERMAGIPGTIGGAVRGNAGAFGMETKDQLARVHVIERTTAGWKENILPREQLLFAYRDSTFKREQLSREVGKAPSVIWSATFSLQVGDRAEGERLVAEDLAARKAKQPYEYPSVGSIFKNPTPPRPEAGLRGAGPSPLDFARGKPAQPAGKLIEGVGLKGLRVGGAEVSAKHANFIVNRGGATARDVLALIQQVKKSVFDTTGVTLTEEIVIL
jgi:UDP-N-acetylmuramate dehydrogenase